MPTSWYPQTRGVGYISDFITDDDYTLDKANSGPDKFAPILDKWSSIQKKYGTDRYMQDDYDDYMEGLGPEHSDDDLDLTWNPNTQYTNAQLTELADTLLREDSKRELCRKCGKYGEETGNVEPKPQFDKQGEPILDANDDQLYIDFPEIECAKGHRWFLGEGKARGIAGKDPILFENHLQDRRRREIYTAQGTPDPAIKQGMYNRTHPQGRKVNSDDQRRRNGASFFRSIGTIELFFFLELLHNLM